MPTPTTPPITPATMVALAATANGQFSVETTPVPPCPPDGAIISLLGAGLCGSDVEKLALGKAKPGQILGHEVVGRIAELGPNATTKLAIGQRIITSHHVPCGTCHYCQHGSESMCRAFKASNLAPGGFTQHFAITAGHLAHTVIPVPDDVSDIAASATEPLACVAKALRRANALTQPLQPGATVVIIGLGYIGLLACLAYRALYNDTITLVGVDKRPDRLQHATTLLGPAAPNTLLSADDITHAPTTQADQVFVSVVAQPTVDVAMAHVREGGVIIPFSRAVDNAATFAANDVYYREIAIVPSYSPNLADLQQAAQWIFTGATPVEALYTHTYPFSQANIGLQQYQSGEAIKVFLTP